MSLIWPPAPAVWRSLVCSASEPDRGIARYMRGRCGILSVKSPGRPASDRQVQNLTLYISPLHVLLGTCSELCHCHLRFCSESTYEAAKNLVHLLLLATGKPCSKLINSNGMYFATPCRLCTLFDSYYLLLI
jgi:hypothetical protein